MEQIFLDYLQQNNIKKLLDRLRQIFRYRILPIYWAFLTYMLLKPNNIKPEELWIEFANMDKFVHILVFIVLGFCYCVAFPKHCFVRFLGIMIGYALLTEILQEVMGLGRTMELWDIIADLMGVIIGYYFWRKLEKVI